MRLRISSFITPWNFIFAIRDLIADKSCLSSCSNLSREQTTQVKSTCNRYCAVYRSRYLLRISLHIYWGSQDMKMMIAFITLNSSLVPLNEGLCSSNPWEFEFTGLRRNRTDDLGINSPSLWPTGPRLHVRSIYLLIYLSLEDATCIGLYISWKSLWTCETCEILYIDQEIYRHLLRISLDVSAVYRSIYLLRISLNIFWESLYTQTQQQRHQLPKHTNTHTHTHTHTHDDAAYLYRSFSAKEPYN